MRRISFWAVSALCGCLVLPMAIGCEAGDQVVRDAVVEPETSDGEKLRIRDGESDENVNLDVREGE